jgi:WXG100 family type VII secretion target
MAITHGMNVDAIEQLSRDLKGQAHQIEAVISSVDRLVNQSQNEWKGKDATDFASWWNTQHRPALKDLQGKLDGLGTSAHNNAVEQKNVSGH